MMLRWGKHEACKNKRKNGYWTHCGEAFQIAENMYDIKQLYLKQIAVQMWAELNWLKTDSSASAVLNLWMNNSL